ncbi:27559_t:CDS:2 [Gigaspora margarita]|uniref:27559_t:CDS:1 n=1 Tax=Gigaspora margarita TaxID=4874 RepID=A0ABN7W1U4_GIGMA|nr:27559_t:CDS:2 [Gigaspora margarita]
MSQFNLSVTNDLKFKIDNCSNKEYYQKLRLNIDKLCSNNTSIDLMETSRSNTSTNLMETSNLVNLIELIETQKELIFQNKLNEINQQIDDIKINITDDTISMDKKNFN